MKLLYFISSLSGGGAERVTVNLANYWAEKGWKVTIVTIASATQDAYALHPSITRISLNKIGRSKTIAGGLVRNFRRASALRQALLDIEPDVAVAMIDDSCVTLALAARGLTNIVTAGSTRAHPPALPTKALRKRLHSVAYGQLSAVVAQTGVTAAWLGAHTWAQRIEVIPNPIQLPLPSSEPEIKPDAICVSGRKMLLAAGRLVPQKGFDLLVGAFTNLAHRRRDWDLVITGEGPERERLQSQIKANNLDCRIMLPGWAGNLADWYRRADLYVMSSRFEGFPNTLAEAMAHGVPAISFDCDTGPKDIIRHDCDGLLVPPEDVPALSAALDRLMGDEELRHRFGAAAQETRNRFSLETVAKMWEDLFYELLNQKRITRYPGRLA
ncbi:MAG: glycosyltransferase family 4 protein [Rhodomicrobium sp.]